MDKQTRRAATSGAGTLAGIIIFAIIACGKSNTSSPSSEPKPQPWPDDVPKEDLVDTECATSRCLLVEPRTELCSVDQSRLPNSGFFAEKSRIAVASGGYPINDSGQLIGMDVVITNSEGKQVSLTPEGGLTYEVSPEVVLDSGTVTEPETFRTRTELENQDIASLFIKAPIISLWPDKHFRLGDSGDMWWWLAGDRRMTALVESSSTAFPAATGLKLWFAPCEIRDSENDVFRFELTSGDVIELHARSMVSTGGLLGRYIGRLTFAKGSYAGANIDVSRKEDLAFYGHTDQPIYRMPDFAVRATLQNGTCGLLFDSVGEDAELGWKLYEMTCDETRGTEIELLAVSAPEKYEEP